MTRTDVVARLDRIERALDTLTQWAERTAGQLMYSPRATDEPRCVISLSGAQELARMHCPREPQETTEAWLERCDRLGEQIQRACTRVVRADARNTEQDPLVGAFDAIDEAVRCRAILGRRITAQEFCAVQRRATVDCRTANEVLAAFKATPAHPAAADARTPARTGARS